jgi:hypothetical protein
MNNQQRKQEFEQRKQKNEERQRENEERQRENEERQRETQEEFERLELENKEFERIEREKEEKYEAECEQVMEKLRSILRIGNGDFNQETVEVPVIKNTIITAPTQVGKTRSIIELCKESQGWLSTISCDDKKDQMDQIIGRMKDAGINVYTVKTATESIIAEHIVENENVVVVILNNKSQIYKLTCLLERTSMKTLIKKYLCIHDESDMINKSDDVADMINPNIAASHREWIKHFEVVKGFNAPIRRIWVTATCENCSNLHNIQAKDIIVLPTPETYRPVNVHVPWIGGFQELYQEIERIREAENGEVILYCYEKLTENQLQVAKDLSGKKDCLTIVYNSKGTVIFYKEKSKKFDCTIDDLLARVKRSPITAPVVVFGSELMNRGLSFVGKGIDPLTATVMFYKAGLNSHVVGMVQKFGRITGSARPDLYNRKIYCSQAAYEDYTGYIENQNAVYNALLDYPELNMTQILGLVVSRKLNRPVDRPVLKKVNKEYSQNSSSDSGVDTEDGLPDEEKMKRLVKSWAKMSNITRVAKLFRDILVNNGSMLSSRVRELMNNEGQLSHLTNVHNKWNCVFYKDDIRHHIREEAMEYYETLE